MQNQRLWVERNYSKDLFYLFLREGAFTPLISRLLVNRGFDDVKSAYTFLYPQLTDFSDPFKIPEMDLAVKTIAKALKEGIKIGIYGDSDVDGVIGSYILYDFLSLFSNEKPLVIIPDKNTDGYGFHSKFLSHFKEAGVKLILTVDVGVSSYHTIELAKALGLEVIITDHHEILQKPNTIVVSGKSTSPTSPFYHLCGAGVVFTLIRALRSYLYQEGFFSEKNPPSLRKYLEIVAIATLADMVPIMGENRVITYFGFRDLFQPSHPSLQLLFQALGLRSPLSEEDLSFKIIPRFNACARMGKPEILFYFLKEEKGSPSLEKYLYELNALYEERQSREIEIWEKLEEDLIKKIHQPLLMGIYENIPKALLGLLANRAKNKYGKPVLILSRENSICYGSGRSIDGIDLLKLLLPKKELFIELGGHQKAFGFQITEENLKELETYLISCEELQRVNLSSSYGYVDAMIDLSDLLFEDNLFAFYALPPYGMAHDPPFFLLKNFKVEKVFYLKEKHTKLLLKEGQKELFALSFNKILSKAVRYIIGTPYINNFTQKLEIRIEDVKE